MNTRRELLIGFGMGLLLTAAGALPAAGAASPADTVRAYLAARARHGSAGQYALFSAKVRAEIPYAQFDTQFAGEKAPLAHAAQDGVSPVMVPLGVFFMDSHGVSGYRFSVIGPDPGDSRTVFVRARPPGAAPGEAFLIKIVTVPEAGGAPRMELLPSYEKTIPRDFAVMREHDRRLSSLSNLKQIGLALIMYAQAHDGRLPDANGWVDALQSQWAGGPGGDLPDALFRDPSAPGGEPFNYAFNRALSGKKLSDLESPAATVLLFESTDGKKNASDAGNSLPTPGRHKGGTDYAFADGHVKWISDAIARPSFLITGK